MPLRAVLFDMGGTLVEDRTDVGRPWREPVLQAIQREFDPVSWAETLYAADDFRRRRPDQPYRQETNHWLGEWLRERGEILTDEKVERLRVALARPLPAVFSLGDGAEEALRWCKARGLAVVVVTNTVSRGDEQVRDDFERLGMSDLIDHVVSSYSTGWEKPHRAIFERALSLAGAGATEACNIGDRLDLDIVGAKALGMRAVWISSDADPSVPPFPDARIRWLRLLPGVLEKWSATDQ